MRWRVLLCLLAASVALVAVERAGADGAVVETVHWSYPVNDVYTNPCTGDLIAFSGTYASVAHMTVDATGDIHVHGVSGYVHAVGTDLVTGETFHLVGTSPSGFSFDPSGVREEYTFQSAFQFVGPGPGNNLIYHHLMHLTVNANGEVTATFVNASIECH